MEQESRIRFAVSEGRFSRVLIGFMALGFVALMAAGLAIAWINQRNTDYTALVLHTQDVRQAVAGVQVQLEQSETARRGYLLQPRPIFRTAYDRTSRALLPALQRLRAMTIDNPRQSRRVDQIEPRLAQLAAMRDEAMRMVDAGRVDAAQRLFRDDASVTIMRGIRYRLQAMGDEETGLMAERSILQRRATRLFYAVSGIAAALLAIVALVSLLVVFRTTRQITASRDALRQLNDTLEEQVVERTADLSRANEEIQRFAYIVSHDLRSPLVNVMGFTAELSAATGPLADLVTRAEAAAPDIVTQEARLAAREDLPEAIGFIRSSTQKMDRLINAILKLSREGRRVIAPEPLDLAGIAEAAVAAIRHVIDDRGVVVTVEQPMPPLVSDRLAVEQILSNLIENATKYLQPGRPGQVRVSATAARGRVIVSVADNGRGIDPRDHQRIFDLFRRSGTQDQPGEGIGLAHVRALAYRLGGTIDVASRLGEGATFRLNLPVTFQTAQDIAS